MPLQSSLFANDPKLEACLISDPAHLTTGDHGQHVSKVQLTLIAMNGARIGFDELTTGRYGIATATAVLNYKTRRSIVNISYQTSPDNIVGKMTLASLDSEMVSLEGEAKDSRRNTRRHPSVEGVDYADSYTLRRYLLSSMIHFPST